MTSKRRIEESMHIGIQAPDVTVTMWWEELLLLLFSVCFFHPLNQLSLLSLYLLFTCSLPDLLLVFTFESVNQHRCLCETVICVEKRDWIRDSPFLRNKQHSYPSPHIQTVIQHDRHINPLLFVSHTLIYTTWIMSSRKKVLLKVIILGDSG